MCVCVCVCVRARARVRACVMCSPDLHLGDAHFVPVDDVISRTEGKDMVSCSTTVSHTVRY